MAFPVLIWFDKKKSDDSFCYLFFSVPQAHLPSSSDEPRNYSSSAPRGSTDLNNGVTIFPMGKVYKNNSSSSSTPTPPPSLPDNNPVNLTIKRDDSEYTNDDSDIGKKSEAPKM